jgi:hypothetical protein
MGPSVVVAVKSGASLPIGRGPLITKLLSRAVEIVPFHST